MPLIELDGDTVRVDDDGPWPLAYIAHWLNDVQPLDRRVRILALTISTVVPVCTEAVGNVIGVLELVLEVLCYYCSDYRIAPTKYVTAPTTQMSLSSGEVTVTRS